MKRVIFFLICCFFFIFPSLSFAKTSNVLDVPFIKQMPELPRGCEVTSLTMLLQYADVDVDKMTLAEEIKKVPFKHDGFFGNPYDGFVGDMYSFDKPGLGVYHGPIFELANNYLPNSTIDLTGEDVSSIYKMIDNGSPVWVIINSWFSKLPKNQFQTWNTLSGDIDITYREHSVVVTGYDEQFVYINDPLYHEQNRIVDRKKFEAGWVQMGSQGISIYPEVEPVKINIPGAVSTLIIRDYRSFH